MPPPASKLDLSFEVPAENTTCLRGGIRRSAFVKTQVEVTQVSLFTISFEVLLQGIFFLSDIILFMLLFSFIITYMSILRL